MHTPHVQIHACTLLALSALVLSVYFSDSCRSSHLSFTHFKESPIPLKVPFSLVLMADRLWPHSLSSAACPHCVPLSERGVWVEVEDRLTLDSECLTRMYGLGEYLLIELNCHPPASLHWHMHPPQRGEETGRERDEERVLVAL